MKILLILFLSCIFFSCNKKMTKHFDLQGHRGCRGLMPENTIPAMLEALRLGVSTLEMDAVITADDKVIVSHEPFFNHEISTNIDSDAINETNEKNYNIYQMTYDSVQKFDVGLKPHSRFPEQKKIAVSKPLLSDLLDETERFIKAQHLQNIEYNIEIKSNPSTDNIYHPAPEKFADLLVGVIQEKKLQKRVVIQSFDPRGLLYISNKYPELRLSLLIENDKIPTDSTKEKYGFLPQIISPDYSLLTKEIVTKLHKQNIRVIPWTVNDIGAARSLYKMRVDGLITDYPDRINTKAIMKGD
jgi:glycerophosphoryl diester phosphodiesterase